MIFRNAMVKLWAAVTFNGRGQKLYAISISTGNADYFQENKKASQ